MNSPHITDKQRKIIHIDMDAFFASVEQLDEPRYRGKPLIVGGDPNSRGVVAAASYEARAYGIHSAMPSHEAYRRCPHAIFVRPRFERYRQISQHIRTIMQRITPIIEPLSLDEAYLDVSGLPHEHGSATRMAQKIRQDIFMETGLTASAGVSYNKMLAKIASDLHKPNGIAVITPQDAQAFIDTLPIERFHGIGKATAKKMHALNIVNGATLRATDPAILIDRFGKVGKFYADIARGIDLREVKVNRTHHSIGSETTFQQDLITYHDILQALHEQNREAWQDLSKHHFYARTLTIKIKYSDFSQITRSKTLNHTFQNIQDTHLILKYLLGLVPLTMPVRLVGVTFSSFSHEAKTNRQLALW